jgi:hypothetical protein
MMSSISQNGPLQTGYREKNPAGKPSDNWDCYDGYVVTEASSVTPMEKRVGLYVSLAWRGYPEAARLPMTSTGARGA